jgi:hypothetical protein
VSALRSLVAVACLVTALAAAPVLPAVAAPAGVPRGPVPTATPQPTGRRTIALRHNRIDLYLDGQWVRAMAFDAQRPVTLGQVLVAVHDPTYLRRTGSTVELRAALIQTAGSSLVVGAPDVSQLRLEDAPGVMLGGSGAQVRFDHVHVTSWDDRPAAPDTQADDGRPFVLYQRGSRLAITDSTFSYLGGHDSPTQGVTCRLGCTATIAGSLFEHNGTGAVLSAAGSVVLSNDQFVTNDDDGLVANGASTRLQADGVTATGNGGDGIALSRGLPHAHLADLTVDNNSEAGVSLAAGVVDVVMQQVSALQNGATGMTIDGANGVTLSGVTAQRDHIGIRVTGGSSGVSLDNASLSSNSQFGLSADDAPKLALHHLTVRGPGLHGLDLSATGATFDSSTVAGVRDAVRLSQSATLTQVTINDVVRGIVVDGNAHLTATSLNVQARHVGLDLDDQSAATVADSAIHAPIPHRGGHVHGHGSSFTGAPFPWLIAFGLMILLVAIGLEVIRHVRSRDFTTTPAPPDVWNTTC